MVEMFWFSVQQSCLCLFVYFLAFVSVFVCLSLFVCVVYVFVCLSD